ELLRDPLGHVDVVSRIRIRDGRHLTHLRADQPEHVLLLLRLGLGEHDHGAIAARVSHQREPDAGVPRRSLDDHAAGADETARLGVAEDGGGGAVLEGAAGIQDLGLPDDRASGELRRLAQPDERRVADGLEDAVADVHGGERWRLCARVRPPFKPYRYGREAAPSPCTADISAHGGMSAAVSLSSARAGTARLGGTKLAFRSCRKGGDDGISVSLLAPAQFAERNPPPA